MSYTFKNLANVELLNVMPENANMFVEVDGSTKRAPQLDVTGELVAKEVLEEVPEDATVLAEVNGEIKRVPGSELGGAKAIVYTVVEDNSITPRREVPAVTYKTICSHTAQEVNKLMLEGASCTLVIPWEALMSINVPATLSASAQPTFITVPVTMYGLMDDGANMPFFYVTMMDIMIEITHFPDETIINNLFPTESES